MAERPTFNRGDAGSSPVAPTGMEWLRAVVHRDLRAAWWIWLLIQIFCATATVAGFSGSDRLTVWFGIASIMLYLTTRPE